MSVLLGKSALITGGAKGLGHAVALHLAGLGCNVAINYLSSAEEAAALADTIRGMGREAVALQGDVAEQEAIVRIVDQTCERLGGIDILINGAGPFIRERKVFADYAPDEIDYMLRANLLGVLQLDRLVLPLMRKNDFGRIVHFGFGHAAEARGWPHRAVYAAAKVGLVSFTKTLAEEEAEHGITVNMICPGDIRGANKQKRIADAVLEKDEETPRGRPGTGEDVARMVGFLCMPESDFITGSTIDITGGLDPIQTMAIRRKK